MWNRILWFLRNCSPEVRDTFFMTMLIALLFPAWTIVSAFGHVPIVAPLWILCSIGVLLCTLFRRKIFTSRQWLLPLVTIGLLIVALIGMYVSVSFQLWVLYVIGALLCHRWWFQQYNVFAPRPWLLPIVTIALIIVSLTGAMDNIEIATLTTPQVVKWVSPLRYVGSILGTLCGEAAIIVLGVFAFTGIFLGLGAIAPITPQLDFPDVKKSAQDAFKGFAIAAFWLGLFAGAVGIGAPRLPWELTLAILLLAVIIIPGNLATAGDTAFKVTYYFTVAVMIAAVLGVMWYLTNTLVPGILEPPARYLVAALVIAVFYGACLAISFNLKQGWLYTTGEIISLLLVVSVACLWFFHDGGKGKLDSILGVPSTMVNNAQTLTWGVMYATLILNVCYGLSGVITKKKIRLLFGLILFCAVLGGAHLVDGMFWQGQPLTGEYQELLKKSGFGK